MKRRLVIIVIIFCGLCGKVFAQSQFSPVISKMENSLFGFDYSSQNDEQRLKRIEERVYGEPSSRPINLRIDKLINDLAAEQMGQEIEPKRDTFAYDEDRIKETIPKSDSSVNYPIVNKLENKIFSKEFKNLDIGQRLDNLEKKTFNKVYNDDLNSRVERLKDKLAMQKPVYEDESTNYNDLYPDNFPQQDDIVSGFNSDYNSKTSVLDDYQSDSDIRIPLSALEKSVFKEAYADDTVNNRLSRLESRIFSTNFSQDDSQVRLERLSSANRAKKTSKKYDNNKFTQHASAAMQIGAMLLMVLALVL